VMELDCHFAAYLLQCGLCLRCLTQDFNVRICVPLKCQQTSHELHTVSESFNKDMNVNVSNMFVY
jgi:hypothetical protein